MDIPASIMYLAAHDPCVIQNLRLHTASTQTITACYAKPICELKQSVRFVKIKKMHFSAGQYSKRGSHLPSEKSSCPLGYKARVSHRLHAHSQSCLPASVAHPVYQSSFATLQARPSCMVYDRHCLPCLAPNEVQQKAESLEFG